jgi:hypothetical protein
MSKFVTIQFKTGEGIERLEDIHGVYCRDKEASYWCTGRVTAELLDRAEYDRLKVLLLAQEGPPRSATEFESEVPEKDTEKVAVKIHEDTFKISLRGKVPTSVRDLCDLLSADGIDTKHQWHSVIRIEDEPCKFVRSGEVRRLKGRIAELAAEVVVSEATLKERDARIAELERHLVVAKAVVEFWERWL